MNYPYKEAAYSLPEPFLAQYREAILKSVRARNIAVEALTEEQTCEVFMQAIASGDIIRNVVVNSDLQSVVYMPYAERESLLSRIKELEDALERIKFYIIHSEPVGAAYAIQEIAIEALAKETKP